MLTLEKASQRMERGKWTRHWSVPVIVLLAFCVLSADLRSTITMGRLSFATVGYMTVYNYYVYPDKTRPRVR
jgi:hypothetical protein